MPETIEKKIEDIIDFDVSKTNDSNFTKSFISEHKGVVPVYGASLDETEVSYGFVEDNLPSIRYFDDCLTWNIDGSVGIFYRQGHFSLSEKVIPLIPKEQFKSTISLQYLKFAIMHSKEMARFNFSNKAGKNKLKEIRVKIPILDDGSFDLKTQNELALKYQEIENKKKILLGKIEQLKTSKILINNSKDITCAEVSITELFIPKNGKSLYTKEWCQNHSGRIPLYSGNTSEPFAFIDVADYEGEYITWAKDGLAGYLMYHNKAFSITGHRGILIPTDKCVNIDLFYIKHILEPIFRAKIKGRMGINGKNEYTTLNSFMIKNIKQKLKIPIKPDGSYDLEKQHELAQKYATLESIKMKLDKKIQGLIKVEVH